MWAVTSGNKGFGSWTLNAVDSEHLMLLTRGFIVFNVNDVRRHVFGVRRCFVCAGTRFSSVIGKSHETQLGKKCEEDFANEDFNQRSGVKSTAIPGGESKGGAGNRIPFTLLLPLYMRISEDVHSKQFFCSPRAPWHVGMESQWHN